jgi:NCAIR mutase (PurE)-related protein
VIIFVDDHLPAHVHVFGDGQAKVNLAGAGGTPELVWAEGMTRAEVRKAMRVVVEQQAMLLGRWRDIHG